MRIITGYLERIKMGFQYLKELRSVTFFPLSTNPTKKFLPSLELDTTLRACNRVNPETIFFGFPFFGTWKTVNFFFFVTMIEFKYSNYINICKPGGNEYRDVRK